MIFIYELDQYSLELYRMRKYELPIVKAFESYHQTDRQTKPKLYTTPLRRWLIIRSCFILTVVIELKDYSRSHALMRAE